MSFILEALKKAEQERNLGRAPDLQTVHALPESPRRRLWPWLLTAALLINAGIMTWLLVWFPSEQEASTEVVSTFDKTPEKSSADSKPKQNETFNTAALEPRVSAPRLTAPRLTTPRLTTNESLIPRESPEITTAESSWSPLEIPNTETAAYLAPLQPPAPELSRRVEIASAPLTTDSLAPSLATDSIAPPLEAMSADFRKTLPTLNLDIHVYSERPERRFVLINSKRYQQGEWLDEGPLLESITLDGVVLSFLDQRFTINVQR